MGERKGSAQCAGDPATHRRARRLRAAGFALTLALVGSTVTRSALAEGPAPGKPRALSPEQQRQVLLRTLDSNAYGHWMELIGPGFIGSIWLWAAVSVAVAPRDSLRAQDWPERGPPAPAYTDAVAVGGMGVTVAAAAGTYLLPDEYIRHGGALVISQTVATAGLWNYLGSWDNEPATRVAFGGAIATGLSLSAIVVYDALVARPTSWTKVRKVKRRLADASPGELRRRNAEAETEIARAANHVPFWVPLSVIMAGLAVQVSPSFKSGVPADERQYTAVMAGVSTLAGYNCWQVLYGMNPLPERYQEALSAVTLAPVGPTGSLVGASLVGRF